MNKYLQMIRINNAKIECQIEQRWRLKRKASFPSAFEFLEISSKKPFFLKRCKI